MSARPPRIAAYMRVSTEEQTTDPQRKEILAYCERRGLSSQDVTFFDETISSQKRSRPQFEALKAAANRRQFDILVVVRLDRLGRKLAELVVFLDDLHKLNIAFASLHEGFDSSTAAGNALLGMAGVFAEFERSLNSERTKAGLASARAKGVKLGRRPDVRGKLQAPVVANALDLHGSIAKAARALKVSTWSLRQAIKRIKDQEEAAKVVHPGPGGNRV